MNNKLIATVGVFLLFIINTTNISDKIGHNYLNKSIKNASTTFLVARGLNGIISVVQDADISATPAGVGISMSPGEILDPFNDLIEKFSSIMLLATASLGIQKILLIFSGWWITKTLIDILLVIFLTNYYFNKIPLISRINKLVICKSLIILLSIRLVVPFIAVSSGIFDSIFINDSIIEKTESLHLIEQSTSTMESKAGVEEDGWYDSLISKAKEIGELPRKTMLLKQKLSNSVANIIDLIALFIIQTILLPLAFLYLATKLTKHLFGYDLSRFFPLPGKEKTHINKNSLQEEPLLPQGS